MTYKVKSIGEDAVSLVDEFGESIMRVITTEIEPGKFAQEPVMRRADGLRIAAALRLSDAVKMVANGYQMPQL